MTTSRPQAPPVVGDRDLGAVLGQRGGHPRHPDHLAELGRAARARDLADRPVAVVGEHRGALVGHVAVGQREADERRLGRLLGGALERPPADEVLLLVELDDPRHRGAVGRRLRVGVLADEDVHLLQAQHPLRLEAERADAVLGARLQHRVPEVLAVRGRVVDLVADLADEADAQDQARRRPPPRRCLPSR